MAVRVDIYHHLTLDKGMLAAVAGALHSALDAQTEQIMGALEDKVAEINQAIAAEKDEVSARIADLSSQVDALKAQVAGGADQAAVLAMLDGIKAGVEGIFTPATPVNPAP
jgi:phosphoglycerate-specific signal transduction histidine kinase